ncbi:MAG: hypothetical protein GXO75_18325, partial [Calditrichaeota bacterium]|nr:hypothetical protein [Calditrichota bacterium]
NGFYTGTRFYFRGALDDLIDKNPGVLLRAVQNAPKEDREKVMEMIREHEKKGSE